MQISTFIRSWLTRIRHASKGLDSRERCRHYSSGLSDCLEEPSEMGHYWMIAGYCRLKFQQPSVLDVGCGRGLLEEKLRAVSYSSYTGMDISMPALKKARQRIQPSCQLICADLLNPPIRKHFDVVIFNESLIPGMPITDILRRYFGLLTADGRIIMSLFNGRNRALTRPVWEEIRRSFQMEDATDLENLPSRKSWTIALLAP